MDASATSVIRDVVLSTPGATLAFERFHVDYCCGGSQTLAEACERAGAKLDEVLAALREEAARPGAEIAGGEMLSVPLEKLIERLLEVHHARSRDAALRLPGMARSVAAREGAARPELARIAPLVEKLFAELVPHLDFEERHVFPYVAAMERAGRDGTPPPVALFGTIAEPIADMEREHDGADRAMHEIHLLAGGYEVPAGAGEGLAGLYAELREHEKDLTRHMHLEGNVLLPRAERLEQKLRVHGRRR